MLFISYSSSDLGCARALRRWLRDQGVARVFLAAHPREGIRAGAQWRDSIKDAIKCSDALLLLVSHRWLDSSECHSEYEIGVLLDKPIVPVLIDQGVSSSLPRQFAVFEYCDLSNQAVEDEGYERLRATLSRLDLLGRPVKASAAKVILGGLIVLVLAILTTPIMPPRNLGDPRQGRAVIPALMGRALATDMPHQVHECSDVHLGEMLLAHTTMGKALNPHCAVSYLCQNPHGRFLDTAQALYCQQEAGGKLSDLYALDSKQRSALDKFGLVAAGRAACFAKRAWEDVLFCSNRQKNSGA